MVSLAPAVELIPVEQPPAAVDCWVVAPRVHVDFDAEPKKLNPIEVRTPASSVGESTASAERRSRHRGAP